MPIIQSAFRRVKRSEAQSAVNKIRKSKYKNAVKSMENLINSKDKAKAKKFFPEFQSILMQVAKSGILSRNTAARKISRTSKKIFSK